MCSMKTPVFLICEGMRQNTFFFFNAGVEIFFPTGGEFIYRYKI